MLGRWLTPSIDADALLARKGSGKEAKLSYCGNLLTENRNGLIVNTEVFPANGLAERAAAMAMMEKIPGDQRVTVGCRQGLRHAGFRSRMPASARHSTRRAITRARIFPLL